MEKIDLNKYKLIIDTIYDATDPAILGSQLTHLLVTIMGVNEPRSPRRARRKKTKAHFSYLSNFVV